MFHKCENCACVEKRTSHKYEVCNNSLICPRQEREIVFKNYLNKILNMAIENAIKIQFDKIIRKKGSKSYSIKIKKRLKDHRSSQGHRRSHGHTKSKNHRRSHNIKTLPGFLSSQGSKGSQGH